MTDNINLHVAATEAYNYARSNGWRDQDIAEYQRRLAALIVAEREPIYVTHEDTGPELYRCDKVERVTDMLDVAWREASGLISTVCRIYGSEITEVIYRGEPGPVYLKSNGNIIGVTSRESDGMYWLRGWSFQ